MYFSPESIRRLWRQIWAGIVHRRHRLGHADNLQLSAEEARELQRRQFAHAEQEGLAFTTASLAALALGSLAVYFMTPEPPRNILILTFMTIASLMGGWRLMRNRLAIRIDRLFLAAAPVTFLGFGWALVAYLRHTPTLDYAVAIAAMYIMTGVLALILYPINHIGVVVVAVEHFMVGTTAWALGSGGALLNWCVVLLVNETFALAFFKLRMLALEEQSLAELISQRLSMQNERLRVTAIEREMELAAELQDALPPWLDTTSTIGAKIGFFQMRRDILGGDWMTARLLPDGTVVVVVADVTGKGLAAAMVVQAVQSLWAETLSELKLDVPAWIHRVNRTLCALGHRHPYTLTLGVIVLAAKQLSYYTAGHVPAFLVYGDASKPNFKPIPARGSLLGIQPEIEVGEAHVDLRRTPLHGVLLGTDGVFDTGGRIRRNKINTLLNELERRGSDALELCQANDDKLLVWIQLKKAA